MFKVLHKLLLFFVINGVLHNATAMNSLHEAVRTSSHERIAPLICQRADVNGMEFKAKPIDIALEQPQPSIPLIKTLLEAQADPNGSGMLNLTPLFRAVEKQNIPAIKLLLQADADTTKKVAIFKRYQINPTTYTPLKYAQSKYNECYNDAQRSWRKQHPNDFEESEDFQTFIAEHKEIATWKEIVDLLKIGD